jgi:DNA-binding transcriptional ArsR family regulator
MAGVTSVEIQESLDELVQQLQQVKAPKDKERLQVLYWLKQAQPPSIGAIAKAIGKHRNTVGTWLLISNKKKLAACLLPPRRLC